MGERVIKNLDELNKALEEEYIEFSTRGLLNHSYHITFGEEEDTYEVYDLADDKTMIMSIKDINEWFGENFTNETFIAED